MENTASTILFFTYFVDLYQTKENDTRIVTVALFCQKIYTKTFIWRPFWIFPTLPEVVFAKKLTSVLVDIKPDKTKENDTGIVTQAMFCQKICLKNPYLAAILNFPTIPEVVITNKVICGLGDIKPDKMIP